MPRNVREKGEFCTYHIIQRGNERKNIFVTEADKSQLISILEKAKQKFNFLLYVYCLMDNHIHLVINDNGNDISQIMKSINVSYVMYFNRVYNRCGHLFQDRFKSEVIRDDKYLLEVSKYIHHNPVAAGMVVNAEDYKWSSFAVYLGKEKNFNRFVDTQKILAQFSPVLHNAVNAYAKYVSQREEIIGVMEVEAWSPDNTENSEFIFSMVQAAKKIDELLRAKNLTQADLIRDKHQRDEVIKLIRNNSSLTLKQIGELFGGMSESRISRILTKEQGRSAHMS